MEEMGEDEVFALVACAVAGVVGAFSWYGPGLRMTWLGASSLARWALLLLPPLALLGLLRVLATEAAIDVRNDERYQLLFVAMGSIWALHLPRALSYVGVSYVDDALERRNEAAALAVGGAVVGLVLLFAGSNMGEGPSIWNTVETALAATAVLALAVLLLGLVTRFGDSISIERDVPSGLRFAAWIVGAGLILGRASAGDWAGEGAMISDLVRTGWPVMVLLCAAIPLELTLRPSDRAPRPNLVLAGVLPALGYLVGALAYVALLPHGAYTEPPRQGSVRVEAIVADPV